MARIAFVTRQIDRAIDVDRQIGVDLNQAAVIALIPVVAAPRFVCDVFDGECFVGGSWTCASVRRAAFGDRPVEDARQPVRRDDELLPERVVAFDQRASPGSSRSSSLSVAAKYDSGCTGATAS